MLPYPMSATNELPTRRAAPQSGQSYRPATANSAHSAAAPAPHLGRHCRRCSVCKHPDRELIEEDFLHWLSPSEIAAQYHLPNRLSVYRHAHAFGLFARRQLTIRSVAEHMLEEGSRVRVTAGSVLKALRAFTQITEDGQWIEPPKRVVVTHIVRNFPRTRRPKPKAQSETSQTPGVTSALTASHSQHPAREIQGKSQQISEKQKILTATRDETVESSK
jgi:hypothetical protein